MRPVCLFCQRCSVSQCCSSQASQPHIWLSACHSATIVYPSGELSENHPKPRLAATLSVVPPLRIPLNSRLCLLYWHVLCCCCWKRCARKVHARRRGQSAVHLRLFPPQLGCYCDRVRSRGWLSRIHIDRTVDRTQQTAQSDCSRIRQLGGGAGSCGALYLLGVSGRATCGAFAHVLSCE